MATSDVGELKIKLTFDGSSAKSSLASVGKEAESQGNALVSKLGGAAKSAGKVMAAGIAAGTTAAAAAVTSFVKGSVESFAEYEQLKGGVETLFKDSSDIVMGYAQKAYQTAQLSANDYMSTVTSFSASLLQSLGGDTAKAAAVADRAVLDMADNANKMGTDISMIQNAYQGFAKQNYMMLDNLKLGYGGTRTEMERLIKEASQMTKEMDELGVSVDADSMSFDNIVNAISVVQKHLGLTGASADEAAGTIQGSFNMMKASWTNFVTGMSDGEADVNKLLDELISSAGKFMENMLPAVEQALGKIVELIPKVVPMISASLPNLITQILPPLISAAGQIFLGIVQALPTLMITLLQGFMAVFPDLINGIVAALPALIDSLIQFLISPDTIAMLVEAGVILFMALVQAVPQILASLVNAFFKLFGNLWQSVQKVFTDFAGNFGRALGDALKGAINSVIAFAESFLNAPINAINGLIDMINTLPGVSIGKLGTLSFPRLAQGGVTTGATTALIGEAGTEAVLPLDRNTGWATLLADTLVDAMGENGGGGVTIQHMEFKIDNKLDAEEIGQVMMTSIRRAAA